VTIDGKTGWGTFLWDAQTRKLAPIALAGMPAVNSLSFLANTTPNILPVINNHDEIEFSGHVADAAGKPELASFSLGRDRTLRPVVLPDQTLPDGATVLTNAGGFNITDSGILTFRVRRTGDPASGFSAYQWENGVVTPLLLVGAEAPGGGTVTQVNVQLLNNRNRSALMALRVSTAPAAVGLYRLLEGKLLALAVPGQEMPGGGKLASVLAEAPTSFGPSVGADVSRANEAGQHVFRARLEDGTRALYRLDVDGALTLLLKQGMATELGEITRLVGGRGIGFNSQGQIALSLRLAGGPETLVLLTPPAP
jgi:hypothetical protein